MYLQLALDVLDTRVLNGVYSSRGKLRENFRRRNNVVISTELNTGNVQKN